MSSVVVARPYAGSSSVDTLDAIAYIIIGIRAIYGEQRYAATMK